MLEAMYKKHNDKKQYIRKNTHNRKPMLYKNTTISITLPRIEKQYVATAKGRRPESTC